MVTNLRESIAEDIQSDQELAYEDINNDFQAVDDFDESDIDVVELK